MNAARRAAAALSLSSGSPPPPPRARLTLSMADARAAVDGAEDLLRAAAGMACGPARNAVLRLAGQWAAFATVAATPIASRAENAYGRRASAAELLKRAEAVTERATPDEGGAVVTWVEPRAAATVGAPAR